MLTAKQRATWLLVGIILGMILAAVVIFGVLIYTLLVTSPEAIPLIIPRPGYQF